MDKQKMVAMAERIYRDVSGAMATGLAHLGAESGLFAAMSGRGPMSQALVIEASGLQPRYVEEWLHGMVCAGYLDYDPVAETYALPEEHAYLLSSVGTDHYMGGMFGMPPPLLAQALSGSNAAVERIQFVVAGFGELCGKFPDDDTLGKLLVANQLQAIKILHFQRACRTAGRFPPAFRKTVAEGFDDLHPVALNVLTQIEIAGLQQAFACSIGEEKQFLGNRRADISQPAAKCFAELLLSLIHI